MNTEHDKEMTEKEWSECEREIAKKVEDVWISPHEKRDRERRFLRGERFKGEHHAFPSS